MPKLSQIAVAAVTPPSGTQFVAVTGGTSDNLYTIDQISSAVSATIPSFPVATVSKSFFVATTGSDSNSGTVGSPFLTLQHAVNVVAAINWNNLYFPTISIANGTYTATQVLLPVLLNCPNGGVIAGNTGSPSSVLLADSGSNYTFTTAQNSNWIINGVDFHGTYGGISLGLNSNVVANTINFSGSLAQTGVDQSSGISSFSLNGTTVTVTSTTMGTLFYTRGLTLLDNATIVFSNAITFTSFCMAADDALGGIYAVNLKITNASNVTATNQGLILTNGCFYESDSNAKVDGVVLTRYNFPGGAGGAKITVDNTCIFQPDSVIGNNLFLGGVRPGVDSSGGSSGNTWIGSWQGGTPATYNGTIALSDGFSNRILDYGLTGGAATNLNFTPGTNGQLIIWGGASFSPGFELNDTLRSGTNWAFNSQSGTWYAIDLTSGSFEIPLAVSNNLVGVAGTAVLGFNGTSNQAPIGGGAGDAGIARNAVGTIEVNTGVKGTLGTLTGASILGGTATGGIGFTKGVGVGGTVSQASSKSTTVILNHASGQITMLNSALAASTTVSFTLTNSAIAAGDVLILNHVSAGTAGSYTLNAQCAAGSALINVRNVSLGSLSEAIVIGFVVIKGATT